jgi:phospholipid/cholesterol/gamma-HCH transport system substrate-binding protein
LPVLFQEKVLQGFENAGYGAAVSRPKDGFNADYQLLIDIRRFVIATSSSPMAEIEFSAKVLGPDSKIIAARTFQSTAAAAAIDPVGATTALNEAFAKSATELVQWTADVVGKAAASAPVTSPPSKASPTRGVPLRLDPVTGPSDL